MSRKDAFSRACADVFRMARYGEVRFKRRTDFKFLLAEKELVKKIPRLLKMYTLSVLLNKALIVVGLYQLQVLRKALCDASHFQPQTKTQSVEWHLSDSPQNKFKATPATKKVMGTFFSFFGMQKRWRLVDILSRDRNVNSDVYIETLKLCRTFSGEFDLP